MKNAAKRGALNLILAAEAAVTVDFLLLAFGVQMSAALFCLLGAALWLLLCLCIKIPLRRHCLIPAVYLLAAVLLLTAVFLPWKIMGGRLDYIGADSGKGDVYGGHSVMAIVPHQDDDINIAGGVLEQYIKYGSEVYLVFVTNGDYYGIGETRIAEALEYGRSIGIDGEHVIFLGYGDQWSGEGPHIYNAAAGQQLVSAAGHSATYGSAGHPAYNMGRAYTSDNLLGDIKSVILEYSPDIILCSDYDSHIDHKAVSFFFEKAMGEILKENPGYLPTVLKAYAYKTAWTARADFYSLNILSTENIFEVPGEAVSLPEVTSVAGMELYRILRGASIDEDPYGQLPQVYGWNERIRLPVAAETLSRSLMNSPAYAAMELYRSQDAYAKAASVVNGDKVFWHRRTSSLMYAADIRTSSGDASLLNDFMLLHSENLLDSERPPFDGAWTPEQGDTGEISVSFAAPVDIYELVLYDMPSPDDNVLNAVIRFDDGSTVETGALDAGGSATVIAVDKKQLRSFTLSLEAVEGEKAGLTEIEAYSQAYESPFSFIKLINGNGDFVYDYVMDKSGEESFYLYGFGSGLPELNAEAYSVFCDNERCRAEISGGAVTVYCPAGEACTVTVSCNEAAGISDSVYIQNPKAAQRGALAYAQWVDELVFNGRANKILENSAIYRIPSTALSLLRRIMS